MPPKHVTDEVPTGVIALILRGISPRIRPTLIGLITFGAMIGAVLWLDARARTFVADAAKESVGKLESRVDASERQTSDQDTRLRKVEDATIDMHADLRALKDDVHYLRERADRRR